MPLSRIEIEEYGGGRWLADVEVGGLVCRRASVSAEDLRALLDAVWAKYVEFRPDEGKAAAVGDVVPHLPGVAAESVDSLDLAVRAAEQHLAEALAVPVGSLEELRRQARELGVEVDMRWREKTLEGYIEMAQRGR